MGLALCVPVETIEESSKGQGGRVADLGSLERTAKSDAPFPNNRVRCSRCKHSVETTNARHARIGGQDIGLCMGCWNDFWGWYETGNAKHGDSATPIIQEGLALPACVGCLRTLDAWLGKTIACAGASVAAPMGPSGEGLAEARSQR